MATAEEFDEFYFSTRRRLLAETYVVSGDLRTSTDAVRSAFVAARHHWAKVSRLSDPTSWVRTRAWRIAHTRRATRRWQRDRDGDQPAEHRGLLTALHDLNDVERRLLTLAYLTSASEEHIRREVALAPSEAEEVLLGAIVSVTTALGCDETELHDRLVALGGASEAVRLPRPSAIRRDGVKRRRLHAVLGSAAAVLVALAGGAFVVTSGPVPSVEDTIRPPVTRSMMLSRAVLETLAPVPKNRPWQAIETSDNTGGTGINTMCQLTRFADADGPAALVRIFATEGKRPRRVVHTVEVSDSTAAAAVGYATTIRWYSECSTAPVRLVDTHRVRGIGDEAIVLRMLVPGRHTTSYAVGIARTGALTTSVVLSLPRETVAGLDRGVDLLAEAVNGLCASTLAGACLTEPVIEATPPPPAAEFAGSLTVVDLPLIAGVSKPWVATDPAKAGSNNPAATTCDRADFSKGGVTRATTRTYLIPRGGLPPRFGLSQTVARFRTPARARAFVRTIANRMVACPETDLGSTVSRADNGAIPGGTYSLWRLNNEVNVNEDTVSYWTGVARTGKYVSQLTLTPVDRYDITKSAFRDLVLRSGERLAELRPK